MPPPRTGTDPELILEHAPYVRALARKLVFDRERSEDLRQDVLLSALESSPREARALKSWLASMVRNMASKAFRSRARRLERETEAARADRADRTGPTPEDILAREDLRRLLVEHVVALAEPVRTVIVLRYLEERPPREIARRLGIPLETVRTRLQRGLAELRGRLDRDPRLEKGSWCLAFANLPGVLAMSLAKKITLTLVALALLSTWWLMSRPDELSPSTGAPSAAPSVEVAAAPAPVEVLASTPELDARTPRAPEAAPEPPAAATTGSILAHVVWEADRTPAPGVIVSLYRSGADPLFDQPIGASDEQGTLRFDGLAPGRGNLVVQRGNPAWKDEVTIVAGLEVETTLLVETGMSCRGLVVDGGDRPIAGAEVLVAGWGGGEALPLARTSADGTFALRAVTTHCHVGARAPGFAVSRLHQFSAGKGAEATLKIVLERSAVPLSGVVLDPSHAPVAGAVVQVGREDHAVEKLPDGGLAKKSTPQRVRTDAHGRFAFESLAPGSHPIAVRARGLAPWHDTIELEAGRARTLTVELASGVTLVGTVRDARGGAAPKASIEVGEWEDLGHRQELSDAGGGFRLEGLPEGEWTARAERDELGQAETTFQAVAGQTLRWDAVLSNGLELRGIVLDADGAPVGGASVEANPAAGQGGGWFAFENTDAEGRFSLKNCAAGVPIRILVRRKGSFPEARLERVVPGADELVIRLRKEAWGAIQGRVLDPGGKPLASVGVSPAMKGANGSPALTADPDTGEFRVGPCPPGEYQLTLHAAGYPWIRVPWHALGPDEVWDVGTLRFTSGGSLLVQVATLADAPAPEHRWIGVLDASGEPVDQIDVVGGVGRAGPFAPGRYQLRIWGPDVASKLLPVEVRAGEEMRVDVELSKGLAAEIECLVPEGTYADPSVQIAITDASGSVVMLGSAWSPEGPARMELCLLPGEYRIEASRDALRGRGVLVVAPETLPARASVTLAPR